MHFKSCTNQKHWNAHRSSFHYKIGEFEFHWTNFERVIKNKIPNSIFRNDRTAKYLSTSSRELVLIYWMNEDIRRQRVVIWRAQVNQVSRFMAAATTTRGVVLGTFSRSGIGDIWYLRFLVRTLSFGRDRPAQVSFCLLTWPLSGRKWCHLYLRLNSTVSSWNLCPCLKDHALGGKRPTSIPSKKVVLV